MSEATAGGDSRVRRIDRYTKTTALMQGGPFNQRLTACRMVLLSDPPAGCSGVEVRGFADPMRLPGARRLRNGVIQTDTVRLVGTWDGYALSLTEPPVRATPPQARPDPVAAPATPGALAAQQRLVADMRELRRQGVLIMQCAPDGDTISVLVPVADDQIVATLTRRYGPVLVSAWLERA